MFQSRRYLEVFLALCIACAQPKRVGDVSGAQWICCEMVPKAERKCCIDFWRLRLLLLLHHHQFLSSAAELKKKVLRNGPSSPPSASTDVKYSCGLLGVVGTDRWKRSPLPHSARCVGHSVYSRASNVAERNFNISSMIHAFKPTAHQ